MGTLRFKSSFAGSGLALGSDVSTLGLVFLSFRYLDMITLRELSTPAAATDAKQALESYTILTPHDRQLRS